MRALRRILVAAALALVTHTALAANAPMVLGIVVEGLDEQFLEQMMPWFRSDGLRRLTDNGLTLTNVDFGMRLDPGASATIAVTGASPAVNGIPGELVYDRSTHRVRPVVFDSNVMGNYTDATYSPAAFSSTTLADEFAIGGGGASAVHAIAPDALTALALSGHAGNSAVWFDAARGNWATTTWYRDLPTAVTSRNRMQPLSQRLDTLQWVQHSGVSRVDFLPEAQRRYPFRHTFPRGPQRYESFAASPMLNADITAMALDYIKTLRLGRRDESADMLSVAYNLAPYTYSKNTDTRAELADAYLRLDGDIARLLEAVPQGSVVWLVGVPAANAHRADDSRWRVPTGQFSPLRAISLLNLHLVGLHGNGSWVSAFHNGAFYLNEAQAQSLGLDMTELRTEAARFLRRMAGVTDAWSIDDIAAGSVSADNADALRRSMPVSLSGDVVISVAPGWEILSEGSATPTAPSKVERKAPAIGFAAIMAPGLNARRIEETVDARHIAPTITRILGLRAPSGASLPALR